MPVEISSSEQSFPPLHHHNRNLHEEVLQAHPLPTNLVRPHLPFVGRQEELARLADALEGDGRVVTLVGCPGVGKSRLVIEFALRVVSTGEYSGGVWFCDVGSARTVREMAETVAAVLKTPTPLPRETVEQPGHLLAERARTLLVLDNFEKVARGGGAVVARWLQEAPEARCIVTSRMGLQLIRERCFELSPLQEEEGVHLFEQRAAASSPGFQLDEAARSEVKALVRRLDGLPLAIELAAGWAHLLSPSQLLDRLSERLDLPRVRQTDVLQRHASLRHALNISWEILPPWEQAAFAQCAIFRGPFSAEAAEAVIDLTAWPEAPPTLTVLASLLDQSLLKRDRVLAGAGPLRFSLHETIHLYAEEMLTARGLRPAAESRHSAYFLGAGESWLEVKGGLPRESDLRRLEAAQAEFLSIFHRSRGNQVRDQVRAALCLEVPMLNQGRRDLLENLLEQVDVEQVIEPALRARLLLARAWSRYQTREQPKGIAELEQALEIAVREDLARLQNRALHALVMFMGGQKIPPFVIDLVENRREQCRLSGDLRGEANHTALWGMIQQQRGAYDQARAWLEEAIALWARAFEEAPSHLLTNIGNIYLREGRFKESYRMFEQARAASRAGSDYERAIIHGNLATLDLVEGRWDLARKRFLSSIDEFRRLGRKWSQYPCQLGLGLLELRAGNLDAALQHLSLALVLCREVPYPADEVRVRVFIGAVHALEGLIDLAEAQLHDGRTRLNALDQVATRSLSRLMRLLEGQVIVARARVAGSPTQAQPLLADARERLASRGMTPDTGSGERNNLPFSVYEELARQLLEQALEPFAQADETPHRPSGERMEHGTLAPTLIVEPHGHWFKRGDKARVMLSRRRALALVLKALTVQRIEAPGSTLTVHQLFELGWPGEHVDPQSSANRVYWALAELRKQGLDDILINQYGSYLLDPSADIRWASEE